MAWIELHQTLPQNKKLLLFKSELKIKTPQAIGHLCMLWLWALDNASDGDLSRFDCSVIAEVSGASPKKGAEFVKALQNAGFVDADSRIHDWESYAGRLIEKRKLDAERKRISRAERQIFQRMSAGQTEDTRGNTDGNLCDGAGNPNHNPNHNKVLDNKTPIAPLQNELFDRFWKAYPRKDAKAAARKAFAKINPDEDTLADMLGGIDRKRDSEQWQKDGGKYIPYAATWLNQKRWEDESQDAEAIDPFFEGVIT